MDTDVGYRRQKYAARLTRSLPSGVESRLSLLIALTLISMLVLLGWAYYQRYQTERTQVLQAELEVAQSISAIFSAYIRDVQRQSVTLGHALTESPSNEVANRLLAKVDAQYVSVYGINWVSPSGRVLASSVPSAVGLNFSDREYFQAVLGGREWVLSELLPVSRLTNEPMFIIATGIRDDKGRLQGVVVLSVEPTRLGHIALTLRRPGDATYTVFDQEGTLVYRSPEVTLKWEDRMRWRNEDPLLKQALQGHDALGVITPVVARKPSFAARIPTELGWVVGTTRPVETALAPIKEALIRDILFSGIVAAVALGLAVVIGGTIAGPLRHLEDDVRAFGEGDLSHRADPAGPREVSQVAAVFNHMAEELQIYQESLEERVRERTAELEASNRELESFSYTVAHDLRSPLRALEGFSRYLLGHYHEKLDERGRDYLNRINAAAQRMGRLIDDLLKMARISRETIHWEKVDLGEIASEIIADLQKRDPERRVQWEFASGLIVRGDRELLRLTLTHLLDNAWKFTSTREHARIALGVTHDKGERVYFVQDNGIGFDMAYADKLFLPFHRLHLGEIFSGTGMGLAIVQRIVSRHGGRIWAEGREGQGATFYFTLGGTL